MKINRTAALFLTFFLVSPVTVVGSRALAAGESHLLGKALILKVDQPVYYPRTPSVVGSGEQSSEALRAQADATIEKLESTKAWLNKTLVKADNVFNSAVVRVGTFSAYEGQLRDDFSVNIDQYDLETIRIGNKDKQFFNLEKLSDVSISHDETISTAAIYINCIEPGCVYAVINGESKRLNYLRIPVSRQTPAIWPGYLASIIATRNDVFNKIKELEKSIAKAKALEAEIR